MSDNTWTVLDKAGQEIPMKWAFETKVVSDEEQVVRKLCELIEKSAEQAVEERDLFIIAVSGGSVASMLAEGLPTIKTCWSKWRVVLCDERIVSANDKESNSGFYLQHLVPATPLTKEQIISIDFSLADKPSENASAIAADYENRLKNIFPKSSLFHTAGGDVYPMLDFAVLGMGPDGHTCSLFPGDTASLKAKSWVIPVTNSPKAPPCRISLTLPIFDFARTIVFPISGLSKASTIKSVLDDKDTSMPVVSIRGFVGKVIWLLDVFAASELNQMKLNYFVPS